MQDFISIPDGDVKFRATEIAKAFYKKQYICRCSIMERIQIAKILRKEQKCNHKQLSRVLGLDPEQLKQLV